MSKKDFSEVIYEALTVLTEKNATDHKRFIALMRDLTVDNPSQMKFLNHNSDQKYLQICSRALHAGDQELPMIHAEATSYLENEFSSSRTPAEHMSAFMIRAYAAYGRDVHPSQVFVNVPRKGPEKPPRKPEPPRTPPQTPPRTSTQTPPIGTGTTPGTPPGTKTGTGAGTGNSTSSGSIWPLIIIVAICLGVWYGYNHFIAGPDDEPTDTEKGQISEEIETHYLRNIQYEFPADCYERSSFHTEDYTWIDISDSVTKYEEKTPEQAMNERKEVLENSGYSIEDTGEVKISDKEGNDVNCWFVESMHEEKSCWKYDLYVPVKNKDRIAQVELSANDDNIANGIAYRDKFLSSIHLGSSFNSNTSCESCGLEFLDNGIVSEISTYSYPNEKKDEIGIDEITFYWREADETTSAEEMRNDNFPYSGVTGEDADEYYVGAGGEMMIGSKRAYDYEYTYSDNLWCYRCFLDDIGIDYVKHYGYTIEADLRLESDHDTAMANVRNFLDTIQYR